MTRPDLHTAVDAAFLTICDWCESPRQRLAECRACVNRNPEYRRLFCIRGCTVKGALMNNGEHEPNQPKRATDGLLCGHCSKLLREWMTTIPDLYATLDSRPEGGLSAQYDGKTHKAGKLSHSPALARLDVIALTDRRTMREDDSPGEPVYVPIVVTGWGALFAEEQGLSSKTDTITQALALMTAWWATLLSQPWIDEMWLDMQRISRLLNRAHGLHPGPQLRGHCQDCGHELWAEETATSLRCSGCKITYTGINILLTADDRGQAEKGLGVG